jgi:type IV pilus assembly protein PilA
MVVVAIIGILALLGLRLYTGQQDKAKEAIVKANAGTVQTLIQAELADGEISDAATAIDNIDCTDGGACASMQNPFGGDVVVSSTSTDDGVVNVSGTGSEFTIVGHGKGGKALDELTAQR